MWSSDDQHMRAEYATELGEEWTEVEPGIFVRVEQPRLQVVADTPEPQQTPKGVT